MSDLWLVVVNDEEQYALWPEGRPAPSGWREFAGPMAEEESTSFVDRHWTDMRPAVLRSAPAA